MILLPNSSFAISEERPKVVVGTAPTKILLPDENIRPESLQLPFVMLSSDPYPAELSARFNLAGQGNR